MYVSKLNPENEFLWQRPKQKITDFENAWFDNAALGIHTLDKMMKDLSAKANLSQIYTNHSIRATTITELDDSGFESRHIAAVSGHKSEETIRCYSRKCPTKKKREMCDALTERLCNIKPKAPKVAAQATAPNPDSANFETINFQDLQDWVPIENNAQDFVLSDVINRIEANQHKRDEAQAEKITTPNENPSENATVPAPIPPPIPTTPQMLVPSTSNNVSNVWNISQAKPAENPALPKMIFPYSNVTINYNIMPQNK